MQIIPTSRSSPLDHFLNVSVICPEAYEQLQQATAEKYTHCPET